MKKNKILLLSSLSLITLPCASIVCSCGNSSQETKTIESYVVVKNESHFQTPVQVSKIYENTSFTFSFTLNDSCLVNTSSSYVRCGYNHSHSLDGRYVTCEKSGNTYTFTVDKSIVVPNFVNIYISTYKYFNIDTSSTSSDEFEFIDELTPYPIEGERYVIGFKVKNNKGLDRNNSVISVNNNPISLYLAYELEYDDEIYTIIEIPSAYIKGDVKLTLKSGESVKAKGTNYPELNTQYLSSPVKNNDFYCYLSISDSSRYMVDVDNAKVYVDGTLLSKDKYTLTQEYLKIDGQNVTGDITFDIPPKEYFNVYSCQLYETPTVIVSSTKAFRGVECSFSVWPLLADDILWDNENTYITINDQKLTKAAGDFTVSDKDPDTGAYTVTVKAQKVQGDIYCHFVTQHS